MMTEPLVLTVLLCLASQPRFLLFTGYGGGDFMFFGFPGESGQIKHNDSDGSQNEGNDRHGLEAENDESHQESEEDESSDINSTDTDLVKKEHGLNADEDQQESDSEEGGPSNIPAINSVNSLENSLEKNRHGPQPRLQRRIERSDDEQGEPPRKKKKRV